MPGEYRKNPKNQWPKGFAPNPKGGSKRRTILSKVRRMTCEQLAEVGTMVCEGSMAEMAALRSDPDAPVLKVWFATLVATSMRKGDAAVYSTLMDRIVGKVPEAQHTTAIDTLDTSNDGSGGL